MASEIKVDTIVNAGGDNDSGIDLATNDNIKFNIAGSQKAIIDSSGNVGIGTSSPTITNGRGLVIADATAARLKLCDTTTGEGASDGFQVGHSGSLAFIFNHENEPIQFGTNNTERMRIDQGGLVLIGATSTFGNQGLLQVDATGTNKNGVNFKSDSNSYAIVSCAPSQYHVYFTENCSSAVGTITSNGSSTSYNTSSDYRLKENVVTDWDATTRLKKLKPSRFNFKINKDKTVDGFLAHEVSSIVPEAVTGEKDAMTKEVLYVDEDEIPEGKKVGDVKTPSEINPQGIDQSKLVPLLTKALQEAVAKIETLEAKVTALESK